MGAALVGGIVDSGVLAAEQVAVVERSDARRAELADLLPGVAVHDDMPSCRSAILAVKPPIVSEVAAAAAAAGASRLLSVAAGVTTATIRSAVGDEVAVLRTMPNTPALVGEGLSALTGAPGTGDDDLDWAETLLAAVGRVVRVDEHQLDAVTGLTGSGPAYLFLVAEALIDAGVTAGLPRPTAKTMVSQLLVGSAALLADGAEPAELRAMVTSPGGTTSQGVRVLEQRAVRAAFVDAVLAAASHSRSLA